MGIRELRVVASGLGIKNYAKLKKHELEAAISAASQLEPVQVKPTASQSLGTVAGVAIVVSPTDTRQSIGVLLGQFGKGDARKVRKMLRAAGYPLFAAARRLVGVVAAKAA